MSYNKVRYIIYVILASVDCSLAESDFAAIYRIMHKAAVFQSVQTKSNTLTELLKKISILILFLSISE